MKHGNGSKDITGNKYNLLTVISYIETRNKVPFWNCKCDCGKEKIISGKELKNGGTKSCGCLNNIKKYIDLSGNIYGKLKVLRYSKTIKKVVYFNVKCECGNIKEVRGGDLKAGCTKSCGCAITTPSVKIGEKYGSLTILYPVEDKRTGGFSMCLCHCGKQKVAQNSKMISGEVASCGCKRKGILIIDLLGKTFGHLKVISQAPTKLYAFWNCECICGNIKAIKSSYLIENRVISCGCLQRGYRELGTIYGIYDNQGILKYIGKTVKTKLSVRLNEHKNSTNNIKMKEWFDSIEYKPRIKTLIKNVPFSDLNTIEQETINYYKNKTTLLNVVYNK